jgi:hypothetical protein
MTIKQEVEMTDSTRSGPNPQPTQPENDQEHPPDDQAKRRLPSSQESRDGARPDPSKREDPGSGYIPASKVGQWLDVIAFLAVLTTGCILILIGHLTIGSLTAACAALITLYSAWKHLRK